MPVAHAADTRPLRILVLHQHYWPEVAATAQLLTDLCEDLAARGHEVQVLCGQPSYRITSPEVLPTRQQHRCVSIERVWSYTPGDRSIPKRLVHYGSYFGASLGSALATQRPDVCLVMSGPPILGGVSGTLVRWARRVPFVYSVQDVYPDVAVHLGVLNKGSPVARAAELTSGVTYRSADALVTLSEPMAESLARKGVARERIHVIANWADTSAVTPRPRDNAFARAHGLVGKFVVQYSGNLGLSQGLDSLVDAAELLRHLPVHFVMVGDGNARQGLVQRAAKAQLDNITFLPPQPRELLGELLSSCELGIVTMRRGVGSDLVPSKLYGILAAARPVLAAVEDTTEVARVVRAHGLGLLCRPEDPESLAATIRDAWTRQAVELARIGERGRRVCAELYSRDAATRRYEEVLRDVVTGAVRPAARPARPEPLVRSRS